MDGTYLIDAGQMLGSRGSKAADKRAEARASLVRALDVFATRSTWGFIVVFDGPPTDDMPDGTIVGRVCVRYPRRAGATAADRVMALAKKRTREGKSVIAVTGDEAMTVRLRECGAGVLTPRTMHHVMKQVARVVA